MIRDLNDKQRDELFKSCELKKSGKINDSWNKLGKKYGCTGEQVRCWYNKLQIANGQLKGKYEQGKERILVMSDLHVPEHDEEMILKTIEKHKDISMLILGGDIIDCKAVSSFLDSGISVLDSELIQAHFLIRKIQRILSKQCKIILVKGNHEHRVNTLFNKQVKQMGSAIVETEILYKLANGFTVQNRHTNVRSKYPKLENVFYCEDRTFVYGDLLVNHPAVFSKNPLQAIKNMYENTFRFKYTQCKVFLMGHTHQLGICFRDNGVLLGETGCMSYKHDYANDDTRAYGSAQLGYITFEMLEKKVQIETIKVHSLGPCREQYSKWKLEV